MVGGGIVTGAAIAYVLNSFKFSGFLFAVAIAIAMVAVAVAVAVATVCLLIYPINEESPGLLYLAGTTSPMAC